jgi:hypothetical protein
VSVLPQQIHGLIQQQILHQHLTRLAFWQEVVVRQLVHLAVQAHQLQVLTVLFEMVVELAVQAPMT